jgi:hypothetical protein
MRVSAIVVLLAGALLVALGLTLLGVATLMIGYPGSTASDTAGPYFVGGVVALIVGGLLVFASVKFGYRRGS